MKEKIKKLLNSTSYEDVVIGIELSFNIPFEDYVEIWKDRDRLYCKHDKISYFSRAEVGYAIGQRGHLYSRNTSSLGPSHWNNLGIKEN